MPCVDVHAVAIFPAVWTGRPHFRYQRAWHNVPVVSNTGRVGPNIARVMAQPLTGAVEVRVVFTLELRDRHP